MSSKRNVLRLIQLSPGVVLCLCLSLAFSLADSTQKAYLSNLQLSLTTDKVEYAVGEPVNITLSLKNLTDRELRLQFPTSQQFDFVVRSNETEVWRWSQGRMFAMVLTTMVLEAQSSKSHTTVWAQNDKSGRPVPPGRYEVLALLPFPQPIFSQPVHLVIR